MSDIEQSVTAQFAKIFRTSDYKLFKAIAEVNLHDAAHLKNANMPIKSSLRLLARNCRKRLLIGVGIELLLKAVFLKNGFCINVPNKTSKELKPPFKHTQTTDETLKKDKTLSLRELIEHLSKVLTLRDQVVTLNGLKIAKVFRNKEGHGVTRKHKFDSSNYRDIERSLIALYEDAFAERLSVHFSIAPKEPAVWRVSPCRFNTQVVSR